VSKLHRARPGNFAEELDLVIARLAPPGSNPADNAPGDQDPQHRANRCPATHNRMLFGEACKSLGD